MLGYTWLAILAPLIGFVLLGLFGVYLDDGEGSTGRWWTGFIGSATVVISFIISLLAFLDYQVFNWTNFAGSGFEFQLAPWISFGGLEINWAFLIDPLSLTMMLIITGIGGLIHIYSTGYMSHDEGYSRFFSYLNLFIAMMLTLVMANNLPVLFIGWEGVGLCSYLLIGFYYKTEDEEPYAPGSAMKAFVVNRIGDLGMLLAMFWIAHLLGGYTEQALNFSVINSQLTSPAVSGVTGIVLTGITLLLFLGATGKSAQIPLYIWLPDAMAGPTPVSALIHAATMVTAGVYMIVRLHPIFLASQTTMVVIAVVGAATALLAATIALTQKDIKKVLAYSTVSQLGYMFLATGVGAFWVAIFHLFTHAFFKAGLFLGSGSVLFGLSHEQNMDKMGGLEKYMPVTAWTYWVFSAAIAGIPPLAGFFSKDEVLWKTFTAQGLPGWLPGVLYGIGAFTALLTSFYIFRSYYKTFKGEERWQHYREELAAHAHGHGDEEGDGEHHDEHGEDHAVEEHDDHGHGVPPEEYEPNECTPAMRFVLRTLAIGSIVVGFLGLPHVMTGGSLNVMEQWLGGTANVEVHSEADRPEEGFFASLISTPAKAQEHGVSGSAAGESGSHGGESAGGAHGEGHGADSKGGGHGAKYGPAVEWGLIAFSVLLAVIGWLGAWWFFFPAAKTEKYKSVLGPIYDLSFHKWYVDEIYDALVIGPGKWLAWFFWRYIDAGLIDGIVNSTAAVTGLSGDALRKLNTGYIRNYALIFLLGVSILVLSFVLVL